MTAFDEFEKLVNAVVIEMRATRRQVNMLIGILRMLRTEIIDGTATPEMVDQALEAVEHV